MHQFKQPQCTVQQFKYSIQISHVNLHKNLRDENAKPTIRLYLSKFDYTLCTFTAIIILYLPIEIYIATYAELRRSSPYPCPSLPRLSSPGKSHTHAICAHAEYLMTDMHKNMNYLSGGRWSKPRQIHICTAGKLQLSKQELSCFDKQSAANDTYLHFTSV